MGARLTAAELRATRPSPSPLVGEGKDEGSASGYDARLSVELHPGADPSSDRRFASATFSPLKSDVSDFNHSGCATRQKPNCEARREGAPVPASGLPAAFFWINLAQRRDRLP